MGDDDFMVGRDPVADEETVAELLGSPLGDELGDDHFRQASGDESSTDKCCQELGLEACPSSASFDPAALMTDAELPAYPSDDDKAPAGASEGEAAPGGHEELLGESGEEPVPPDMPGINRALQSATLEGNPEVVRKLICMGAMVNAPISCSDEDGDVFVTLLHVIAGQPGLKKGKEVLTEIAHGKANLNARSFMGSTPLARACLHKHIGAVEVLLELGADVRPVDDRGRNALRCAVSLQPRAAEEDVEEVSGGLVSLLASRNANMDSGGDAPPLLEAIRQGNRRAVAVLIANGAKPTSLHVAVDKAPKSIIEDLLKAQANPFAEDPEGKSVLDIAFRRGDEEITTLLRDFIGDLERRNVSGQQQPPEGQERRFSVHTSSTGTDRGSVETVDEDMTLGLSSHVSQRQIPPHQNSSGGDSAGSKARRRFSLAAPTGISGQRKKGATMLDRTMMDMGEPGVSPTRRAFNERFAKFQLACRRLNRNKNFQLLMFAALLAVLFFPDLWVVCDVEGNEGLDIILIVVLLLFVGELLLQVIGTPKTYVNSFFFWMDIVGLLSVPLDLSVVTEGLPQNLDNAVVMRAARTARLGARAGRFTKLVKLLRFLPGVQMDDNSSQGGTAKTMSRALMTSLSTRVSCLIIVMVMLLPLFEMATYPENDFSMKTWMNSLEFSLGRYGTTVMQRRLADFENFYENKDYYPFEVQWDVNGTSTSQRLKGRRPRRTQNELEIKADSGALRAVFNFGPQNRVDALCNMILIVVIIVLMMGFSMLLSNSVSIIVLGPLDNLLRGVKRMASKIFKSVTHMAATCSRSDEEDSDEVGEEDADFENETELLEKVIDKLATLSAITMKTHSIDAETFNALGETDRAVLQGFSPEQLPTIHIRKSLGSNCSETSGQLSISKRADHTEELVQTLERNLEQAGLAWAVVDSFEFNALAIEEPQRQLVSLCFLIFHLGLAYTGEMQSKLAGFVEVAAAGYYTPSKAPYHNWYHAVDVTHCVFRLLNLCATERFLSNVERFALITSALCHDIGHPGLNNPFLVETAHDLAIRYNDRSPLENMHCARLFEIVSHAKTGVFDNLDKKEYKEARQVCIEAILHTDNIHHFAMVKEMQMLYEMNSDVFDIALQMHQMGQVDFPPREIIDILGDPEKKKSMRNLLLHFSDISNPMKPFHICKRWAWNIIDEFFLQGDKEKELGITVQPLNDREKVNKPYSQVGFIEFFVAPFAFATVRVLPPLVSCTDQMMQNLNFWCEEWATTTQPPPEQEEHAKLQERIAKLEAKFVFREGF